MRNAIREHILMLLNEPERHIGDDDSLVISGRMNSIKVIELATWLEEKFNIEFDAHTFHVKDFDSVNDVFRLVKSRQGPTSP
jgi:acyl carrier protein